MTIEHIKIMRNMEQYSLMKIQLFPGILLSAFLICQMASYSQIESYRTPEAITFGQLVFHSFQTENREEYIQYLPTEEECIEMFNQTNIPDSSKKANSDDMIRRTNALRKFSDKIFTSIIVEGKNNGVVWKETTLTDVKFDIQGEGKFQTADIYLYCKYKEIKFTIKLNNCVKNESWWIADESTFKKSS